MFFICRYFINRTPKYDIAVCWLYLVVPPPNCLTELLASSLFYCKKWDLIFRQTLLIFLMFLLLSCFFMKSHFQCIFLHRAVAITFFPIPINKLSILWLEREIAISWCSTTYKTFYLLSVSITLLCLDLVGEVVFPVSVMGCICEQCA